jgi:ribosomal silencing factor RsfS
VHVFYQEMRSFYRLEQLWGDAEDVDISQFIEKTEA